MTESPDIVASYAGVGGVLVDLKGFEPLTSSMPFKKNQSPTDIATDKKGLAESGLDSSGRHEGLF